MSLGIRISIIGDGATPALQRLVNNISLPVMQAHVGPALEDLFRRHFYTLPPNRMGGRSTNFWGQCADATRWLPSGMGVVIEVAKVGARQRYLGGPIDPVNKKYLAIPANPMSYGKNPSEFDHLKYVQFGRGQDAPKALVMTGETSTQIAPNRGQNKGFKAVAANLGIVVMFWLEDHVDQDGNENVIPSKEQIFSAIEEAVHPLGGN